MLSELRGVSEQWFQAWLDKDASTVECLAAEDYVYIAPSGLTMDREAILKVIRSPGYRLDRGTRTEVVVRALGRDAGVVRHRYQGAGSFDGASFTDDQRGLMVWEKRGEEWQLVMEQNSFSGRQA
jgi:ketosteroid isomerase-like protein